jgi:hypothetical protein
MAQADRMIPSESSTAENIVGQLRLPIPDPIRSRAALHPWPGATAAQPPSIPGQRTIHTRRRT